MSVQVIEHNGKPEYAVLPYDEYLQLVEQAELLQDIRDFDRIKEAVENGDEETLPAEVAYSLLDGGNPGRMWRVYKGLSQAEVAKAAGISIPYLSQIETGRRKPSLRVLSAIASRLGVTLDDLAY